MHGIVLSSCDTYLEMTTGMERSAFPAQDLMFVCDPAKAPVLHERKTTLNLP